MVKKLVFTPPAGVTIQWGAALPNTVPFFTAVNVGDTVTRTVTVTGATPGFKCIAGSQHNASGSTCCNISLCLTFPTCDCFQIYNQTFQVNNEDSVVWCFTIQNLSNQFAEGFKFVAPPGVTITPNPLSFSGHLNPYQTTTICATISGAALGSPLCLEATLSFDFFAVDICRKVICIDIPSLNLCVGTGKCTKYMPVYYTTGTTTVLPEWQTNIRSLGNTVAAMTCWSQFNTDPVLAMVNLDQYQCGVFLKGKNWTASATQRNNYHAYHGKPDVLTGTFAGRYDWTKTNLGTVFGVEIDAYQNVFVTHTSANNGFVWTNLGSAVGDEAVSSIPGSTAGSVHTVLAKTGLICLFANLPQGPSMFVYGPATQAGLGNIAYDADHNQYFVTNHFGYTEMGPSAADQQYTDGRIYRLRPSATVCPGTIVPPDSSLPTRLFMDGRPRMSALGTQFWGIAVHQKRLYVSRWLADSRNSNFDTASGTWRKNQIWSAPIEANGDVLESKWRLELELPYLQGKTYSSPVSDIEFDLQGTMYLAERSMRGLSLNAIHESRLLAYSCDSGSWLQLARVDPQAPYGLLTDLYYQVGATNPNTNAAYSCAGGVAPDYNRCGPRGGNRLWATGDRMGDFDGNTSTYDFVYGLTGLPYNGGRSQDEILISGTNTPSWIKTQYNDVDIPCYQSAKGTLLLHLQGIDFSGGMSFPGWVEVRDLDTNELIDKWSGNITAATQFDIRGNFPPKNYDIVVKVGHWLAKRVKSIYMESGLTGEVSASLLNGDCDGDNYIGTNDYLIVSNSFDKGLGEAGYDPRADLNNDGTVNTDDYLILNENFDTYGDL